MRIKHHIAVVVVVCSLGGLGLSLGLTLAYRNLEHESRELGKDSLAKRDLDHLETLLGQWLVSCDLVVSSGQTYMADGTRMQADHIKNLLSDLRRALFMRDSLGNLTAISESVNAITADVATAAVVSGPRRASRLAELSERVDAVSLSLLDSVEALCGLTTQRMDQAQSSIDSRRSRLIRMTWLLGTAYLAGVLLIWRWSVVSMVRPLCALSDAARKRDLDYLPTRASKRVPTEIKELKECVTTFVRERTAELHNSMLEAATANRIKGDFLANMSHEIRTPMTAIIGFADLLLEHDSLDGAPPEFVDAARTIKQNGLYLVSLINDILDLSKIEAGKFEVECVRCSPLELVSGVQSLMKPRAQGKGLPLHVDYAGPIPETIETDPTRLRQILINLLGNAVKFTETGNVRLVVRMVESNGLKVKELECLKVEGAGEVDPSNLGTFQPSNLPTSYLQFDILDTGIGMTGEQAEKVFQPFTQADGSTTRTFGGTGLGLTISKCLAEMLDGDLRIVDTGPGRGTHFRLTVSVGSPEGVKMIHNPAEQIHSQQRAASLDPRGAAGVPKSAQAKAGGWGEDKLDCSILLVEDGPDNQRLISFILKKVGADVSIAENGKEAVEKVVGAMLGRREADPQQPFDVILMDMQMPIMDGYQATRVLRSKGYTGPIIALTAHAMATDREKCLEAGCDDFATKPIDRAKLLQMIAAHLQPTTAATGSREP